MGVGYNLGNSLEAASSGTPNETAYGNPKLTEDLVLAAKDAGFKSIRIPVSYLSMIDDNNGYKIDSSWLAGYYAAVLIRPRSKQNIKRAGSRLQIVSKTMMSI